MTEPEKAAYQFRMKYGFKYISIDFSQLYDLAIKHLKIEIKYYSEAISELKERNLMEAVKKFIGSGFTNIYNGKTTVYLNNELSSIYKRDILLHELGHILLKHSITNGILGMSIDINENNVLEKEANDFKRAFLIPVCKLVHTNIKSPTQIKEIAGVDDATAIYAMGQLAQARNRKLNALEINLCRFMAPIDGYEKNIYTHRGKIAALSIASLLVVGVAIGLILIPKFNSSKIEPNPTNTLGTSTVATIPTSSPPTSIATGVSPTDNIPEEFTYPDIMVYVRADDLLYHDRNCEVIAAALRDGEPVKKIHIQEARSKKYFPCECLPICQDVAMHDDIYGKVLY